MFAGKTKDSMTFSAQVGKLRESFGLREMVVAGDRGLINSERIE